MKVDKDAVVWLTPAELAVMVCYDKDSAFKFAAEVRTFNRARRRQVERQIGSRYALWDD